MCVGVGRGWIGLGNDVGWIFYPLIENYVSTHTLIHTYLFLRKFFFPYDYRTAESAAPRLSDVPGGRTALEHGHMV